jgi:2-(1,2-epoxy-1,2-dihydrophenyl)acetyl-CoA isomerase
MSFYLKPFEDLLVQKINQSLWITLNRPEASNAYSISMVKALVEVLRFADTDHEIRAMVITGAGKHFCAGGDLKAMRGKSGMFAGESNELRESYQSGIQQIPLVISQLKTPLIAMVNGAAVGAGLDLATMCDMRVASTEASFAETRLIGFGKAMEMFLTCKTIYAQEAQDMGLVNKVVQPDQLKSATQELVEIICSLPPIALQMTKKAVAHAYQQDLNSHLELMAAYQGITQRSSDHFTALEGILDKKKTTFKHL